MHDSFRLLGNRITFSFVCFLLFHTNFPIQLLCRVSYFFLLFSIFSFLSRGTDHDWCSFAQDFISVTWVFYKVAGCIKPEIEKIPHKVGTNLRKHAAKKCISQNFDRKRSIKFGQILLNKRIDKYIFFWNLDCVFSGDPWVTEEMEGWTLLFPCMSSQQLLWASSVLVDFLLQGTSSSSYLEEYTRAAWAW